MSYRGRISGKVYKAAEVIPPWDAPLPDPKHPWYLCWEEGSVEMPPGTDWPLKTKDVN